MQLPWGSLCSAEVTEARPTQSVTEQRRQTIDFTDVQIMQGHMSDSLLRFQCHNIL